MLCQPMWAFKDTAVLEAHGRMLEHVTPGCGIFFAVLQMNLIAMS